MRGAGGYPDAGDRHIREIPEKIVVAVTLRQSVGGATRLRHLGGGAAIRVIGVRVGDGSRERGARRGLSDNDARGQAEAPVRADVLGKGGRRRGYPLPAANAI